MTDTEVPGLVRLPARDIPMPSSISPAAQAQMAGQIAQQRGAPETTYPAMDDKAGWRAHVAAMDEGLTPFLQAICPDAGVKVADRQIEGLRVFDITPPSAAADDRTSVHPP